MAGHSHWARIKRAKSVTDARRGRAWSRLSRGIIVAARSGGGDPESNLALRYAIDAARAENMPKDTIERAIKKGTGDVDGISFEELTYEGYGPGGAAFLCLALTDNRTRTAGEIKNALDRLGGNLAAAGSVSRFFTKRGVITVSAKNAGEDRLTEIAIEVGADDIRRDGEVFELTCDPSVYGALRDALESAKIATETGELTMVPSLTVPLSGEPAEKMMKLVEALEENDDVQNVYSNVEISADEMNRLSG
ncbi:MAG: YebC/PmpR family DNA-binding transcriptional regulator [Planctomycetes bacterium]|nr:YebC/PmpR family DNA-binding transcriptional regulator [Planctomycetota bacterium]